MNDAQFFSSLLITHIVQFSLVMLAAGIVVRLTGKRWPHFAFLICMVALVKSLMPPVFSSPAGVFSMHPTLALSTEVNVATMYDKIRHSGSPIRSSPGQVQPATTLQLAGVSQRPTWGAWFQQLPLMQIFAAIWAAGALFFLGRAAWQITRFRQRIREQRKGVPGFVSRILREIQADLSLRRRVDVLISASDEGPAIIGFLRPVLILPRILVSHSTGNQLRPIIAHELVHARRGDSIWGLLQLCAQIVWWFHPFVWWLGRRANMLCERCCDEEAIAGLRCSAADYAESLVRVVAMRNVFRSVPCGNSIRASDVTGQRLERLMQRCGQFCGRTPATTWLLIMCLAVLLLPGAAWGEADETPSLLTPTEMRTEINNALAAEDWDRAVKYLRAAVKADADDPRATLMLGYVLHMQGDYQEALEWHRKATQFAEVRPTALYNAACVLALTGQHAEALEQLEAAIDDGFRHQTDIADDPDFESLRDSERFQQLRTRAMQPSGNDRRREFDFWVGEWDVTDGEGQKLGVNVISRAENGHLLTEKWHSRQGGTGTSVNFFDPADGMWHQIWVDSRGAVIRFKGQWDGNQMALTGNATNPAGESRQVSMTLTPQPDQSVLQKIRESTDGGDSWSEVFDGIYRRKEGSQTAAIHRTSSARPATVTAKTLSLNLDD